MMNRLTIVALVTGALSLSAIISFHPSGRYLQHFQRFNRYDHIPDELLLLEQTPSSPHDGEMPWEIRNRQRRKRTRPPQLDDDDSGDGDSGGDNDNDATQLLEYEVILPLLNDTDLNNTPKKLAPNTSWKTLDTDQMSIGQVICGDAAAAAAENFPRLYDSSLVLTSSSRIIITNVLSSVGMHLALQLSQSCGVSSILGIDALLPNTRRHRMQAMDRYAVLKRRIPTFQKLLIPYTGVWPKQEGEQLRLSTFRPTHIVHLVADYDSQLQQDETHSNPLYPRHDKMLAMEQLLQFIRISTTAPKTLQLKKPPHFIYAGSNLYYEHLLASSYQKLYYQQQSTTTTTIVGIELPRHVYGPWGDERSWAWTTAQDVVSSRKTNATTTVPSVDSKDTFVYVEDAVSALITSMQLATTTVVTLTSDTTKTSLEEALSYLTSVPGTTKKPKTTNARPHLQELIQWLPATRAVEGMQKLLSWHYTRVAHPYGTSQNKKLPPYVVQNYHYQFPCLSECSVPGNCRPSVYDGAVQMATKEVTKGCKLVVYMANFSSALNQLPPSVSPATNETICQVAFISNTSALLQRLTTTTKTNKLDQQQHIYRGWSLLPVSTLRMTEAEFMLPKLSPTLLFDRGVSKALYVEMKTSLLLPHDGNNLLALTYSIEQPPKRARQKRVVRPSTSIVKMEWVPETPAKLVLLFGQEDSHLTSKAAVTMTLSEKVDYLWSDRRQYDDTKKITTAPLSDKSQVLHQHQLRFYEHATHLVQNNERRSMNDLRPPAHGHAVPFWFWHTDFLVHNLRMEESRLLRCEWYDEQVFWQSRNMEDLSLAYILAKRRIEGRHGSKEGIDWTPLLHPSKQHEPMMFPMGSDEEESASERVLSPKGNHLFLRVLRKPLDVLMAESVAPV